MLSTKRIMSTRLPEEAMLSSRQGVLVCCENRETNPRLERCIFFEPRLPQTSVQSPCTAPHPLAWIG